LSHHTFYWTQNRGKGTGGKGRKKERANTNPAFRGRDQHRSISKKKKEKVEKTIKNRMPGRVNWGSPIFDGRTWGY